MLKTRDEPLPQRTEPSSVDRSAIADIAARALALRAWEREHMPAEGSVLGFDLFMSLAQWSADGAADCAVLLKRLYLDLPYSEKGLRLHLRQLEADGWLVVQRANGDLRAAQVELSEKGWALLSAYALQWQQAKGLGPD